MATRRVVSLVLILGLLLGVGCTPTAPAQPPQPPKKVSRVIVALQQEPPNLNPYFLNIATGTLICRSVVEGLLSVGSDGQYIPVLASTVPSIDNGQVSPDGLRVTYKLRPGIVWSDGIPFTSKDVKFTWEVLMNPSNPTFTTAGYVEISRVETPDDLTAVVHFKNLYPGYLTLFPWIVPSHAAGGGTDLTKSNYNMKPLGTGPFVIKEWQSGDHVTVERNPRYREKGKPNLDQIWFRFIPTFEAGVGLLRSGEIDILPLCSDLTLYPALSKIPGVRVIALPYTPNYNERLIVQQAKRGNPADASKPHEILGDVRVRKAIDIAINRKEIVDAVLYGLAGPVSSGLNKGWFVQPGGLPPRTYSPEQAKTLLTAAGWKDTGGKVRTKDGKPLKLELTVPAGNLMRERAAQIIQEQLAKVGIEITLRSLSGTVLWARYADGGTQTRGDYDLGLWADGPEPGLAGMDPHAWFFSRFHSSQIATAAGGMNVVRFKNPKYDKLIDEAVAIADQAKRAPKYFEAMRILTDEVAWVWLYESVWLCAVREKVLGMESSPWLREGWDTANWRLTE